MIRCYQCKWYRGGKYKGKCVSPEYDTVLKVDAVDYCEKAKKKEA